MKAVYEPQSSGSLPLLNADGPQLLIEKKQILERWAKHFDSVPNRPASVNDKVIAHLPQVEPLNWTTSPLKRSKRGCQAALLRQSSWIRRYPCSSIQGMIQKLTQLFQSIWREEKVPQQFKDVSIVQIYKRKGNRQSCDNHRGISLLCIAGNILARVLLNRLLHHLEQGHLPESQCGFHAERGISYMIFPARQLWEKTPGANTATSTWPLSIWQRLSTRSAGTVCGRSWRSLAAAASSPRLSVSSTMAWLWRYWTSETSRVPYKWQTAASSPPPTSAWCSRLCWLIPARHVMMPIRYRMNGRLFNLMRLQAVAKVKETVVRDLLFVDDCALNARTEQ